MSKIKVVAFDPSTTSWGTAIALVDIVTLDIQLTDLVLTKTESEVGKGVRKDSDDLRRAGLVRSGMLSACEGAAVAISEIPFMNAGGYAAANYNSGLVVGVLAGCPIPLIQTFPQEVKKLITGSRHAAKEEMIEWATEKWPAAPWKTRNLKGKRVLTKDNEHLADAAASLYAGIRTDQFKQATAMMRSMLAAKAA